MTSKWWQNPDLKRCEFASSVMRLEWFRVQRPDTTAVPLCWWRTNWVWRAGVSSSCCRTSTTNCCSTVSANTGWTGKVSLSERRCWIESRKMYQSKVHWLLILYALPSHLSFKNVSLVSTLITAEWEFHSKYLTSRHQMMSCYDFGFTAVVDITSTLLLLNPDFTTAWNVRYGWLQHSSSSLSAYSSSLYTLLMFGMLPCCDRKELLQCGVLVPEKDLYLGKLALTKFPKSPETWIHR